MCIYKVLIHVLCIYKTYHTSKRKHEPQQLFKVRANNKVTEITLIILIVNILDFSDLTGKLNM